MDERRDLVDREELRRRIAMVEAVARAIRDRSPQDTDGDFGGRLGAIRAARAVLSVPALRDALARDAKVREIVARQDKLVLDQAIGFIQIRSLHHAGDGWGVWAEDDIPATMLRDGKG